MGAAKKILGAEKAHIEPRKGSHSEAVAYCTKEDTRDVGTTFTELGVPPSGQGSRSDIRAVEDLIRQGAGAREIAHAHLGTYIRLGRGIDRTIQHFRFGRDGTTTPHVKVYYGGSGTGKSRLCRELYPDAYWANINESGRIWWHGYDQQSTVVIDDFKGELPFRYLLRLIDRYPMNIEAKGTCTMIMATNWIITSNHHPKDWYKYERHGHHVPALQRRLNEVYKMQWNSSSVSWEPVLVVWQDYE